MTIKQILCGPALFVLTRIVLGGIFLWAGLIKMPYLLGLVDTIKAYDLVPHFMAPPLAIVMPGVEIVVGVCLLLGVWTRSSAFVSLLMLSVFSFALGVNIYRGADIDCGCFGLGETRYALEIALLQDIVLMCFAYIHIVIPRLPFTLDSFFIKKYENGTTFLLGQKNINAD